MTNPLPDSVIVLVLVLLMIAPLAVAGVALLNTGLGRSRSAAQALLGILVTIAVASIAFALVGASFTGAPAVPGHLFHIAGKPFSWLGAAPWLLGGLTSAPPLAQLALLFQFLAVAMVAILPWGSGADRLRLPAGAAIAAILAIVAFPLAAHWIWGGGWLAQLGANFSLGLGFLDPGGAATVHLLGGVTALAVVWIAGPRRGKFPREGLSTAMPGHNASYVLFGCLLALIGWLGWNLAGAILWIHAPLSALPLTAINTVLSASAALCATFVVTLTRFGKPDASLCANGWMTGLVASCACAALVSPLVAILIGLVAGIFTPLMVELLELALSIDDPSGAITVHAAGGLWGLFAAGIFVQRPGQFAAQLLGIAALLGFFLPLIYSLLAILNRFLPFRADAEGERIGMDLHELGGGAYPDFVIHRDESYR